MVSYKDAIFWLAENDLSNTDQYCNPSKAYNLTLHLFGRTMEQVIKDVRQEINRQADEAKKHNFP